jgi:hypothetical protein
MADELIPEDGRRWSSASSQLAIKALGMKTSCILLACDVHTEILLSVAA